MFRQLCRRGIRLCARPPSDSTLAETQQSSDTVSLPKGQQPGHVGLSEEKWAELKEHLSPEFLKLDRSQFINVDCPGYLTPRATTDVQPAEELLQKHVEAIGKTYDGVDVRDPTSIAHMNGIKKTKLTQLEQVQVVAEFISGHISHHISTEEWRKLFDLQHMEMELMYFVYILHLHLVVRRANTIPVSKWCRRRDVFDFLQDYMHKSWCSTAESMLGRPPLNRMRYFMRDMYFTTATNLEEAFQYDGPGADMMLLAVLIRFNPLQRPEDLPFYSYYTLVHYIRFHQALLDRIPDEEFAKGNFHFRPPDDPTIFQQYTDVELDEIIRGWAAEGAAKQAGEEGSAETSSSQGEENSTDGESAGSNNSGEAAGPDGAGDARQQ